MPQPLSVIWMSLFAASFDLEPDARRASIERVLQHLLYDGGRPLHDLASGDLVGNAFGRTWIFPMARSLAYRIVQPRFAKTYECLASERARRRLAPLNCRTAIPKGIRLGL